MPGHRRPRNRKDMILHQFENGMYIRTRVHADCSDTLVYIHGLGESCFCFEDLVSHPALRGWNHVMPDLPGYGKSPWPEEPMALEAHARYLADWLKIKNITPCVMIGHSMGGVIGLMICEKYPELVEGYINVEGNISLPDCVFSGKAAGYPLDAFVARGFGLLCEEIYQGGLADPALRTYYPSMRMCDPRVHHLNSSELVSLARTGRLASRLAALRMPTLYLLGDPRGTGDLSRRMLSEAGVDWRIIRDAGHWPFIDQRDIFVREILDFLKNLEMD
jgi:haloalkane dehalogenase